MFSCCYFSQNNMGCYLIKHHFLLGDICTEERLWWGAQHGQSDFHFDWICGETRHHDGKSKQEAHLFGLQEDGIAFLCAVSHSRESWITLCIDVALIVKFQMLGIYFGIIGHTGSTMRSTVNEWSIIKTMIQWESNYTALFTPLSIKSHIYAHFRLLR